MAVEYTEKTPRTENVVAIAAVRGSRKLERRTAGEAICGVASTGVATVVEMGMRGSVRLDYLRRKRLRAEAINAPAEPTIASSAVGFSGELTQPVCAFKGVATATTTMNAANRTSFFMEASDRKL